MFSAIAYFFIALLILIIFHEAGHFLAARMLKVKVLRFSFGFGKVLFSKKDKQGTEYAFSLVPLGGYVKLLDETYESVPPSQRRFAFNQKSALSRMIIVLAGPLANFVLAFVIFAALLLKGTTVVKPVVGEVMSDSIAAEAGFKANDEIMRVDGVATESWREVAYALMSRVEHEPFEVEIRRGDTDKLLHVNLASLKLTQPDDGVAKSMGLLPWFPEIPLHLAKIQPNSAAAKAGLKVGDEIVAVNGEAVTDWQQLIAATHGHTKDDTISLEVKRNQESIWITAKLDNGVLGVQSETPDWPDGMLIKKQESLGGALAQGAQQTYAITETIIKWMGMMLKGTLPLKHISGPIGIYEGTKHASDAGFAPYFAFIAIISIGLGVLNLLPIPLLDGGQFLFILLEALMRKPLSDRVKALGVSFGAVFLVWLTVIALKNDIARLVGFES